MPRKRKSDSVTPTESTATVAEAPAVEQPADTAIPVTNAATPEAESFVDKLGPRKPATPPDPFGIARDNLAGVRLFESRQDRQMAIKFGDGRPEDKPSQAVIDRMKGAGFRWNPADRIWTHPVWPDSAMSNRIEAEKLYQEVRQMIRQEKGIEPAMDVPF